MVSSSNNVNNLTKEFNYITDFFNCYQPTIISSYNNVNLKINKMFC